MEQGREGQGNGRQLLLRHGDHWNYLEGVKSTGKRDLTVHWKLFETAFPSPLLSYWRVNTEAIQPHFLCFVPLKRLPVEQRGQEAEKHHYAALPLLLSIPHCAALEDPVTQAPAEPGDPRAGERDSRSRLINITCTSRDCLCSGDPAGAEPPSPKRERFQNSNPESHGTPWLKEHRL